MKFSIYIFVVALLATQCLASMRNLKSETTATSTADAVAEDDGYSVADATSHAKDGGSAYSDADSYSKDGGVAVSDADSHADHDGVAVSDADSHAIHHGVAVSDADSYAVHHGFAYSNSHSFTGFSFSDSEVLASKGIIISDIYNKSIHGANVYLSIFSFAVEEQKIIADFCAYGLIDVTIDVEHSIFVQPILTPKVVIEYYLWKLVMGCPADLLVSALSIQLGHCSQEFLLEFCNYGFFESDEDFKLLFIKSFEYVIQTKTCDLVKGPFVGLFKKSISHEIDTCFGIEAKKSEELPVLAFDKVPKHVPQLPEDEDIHGFPPCTHIPSAQFCCGVDQLKHPKCNCGAFGICQWHQGEKPPTGPAFWKCNTCVEKIPYCVCPF